MGRVPTRLRPHNAGNSAPYLATYRKPAHGISRLLSDEAGAAAKNAPFKEYPLGYLHLDFAEVQTEEGKR